MCVCIYIYSLLIIEFIFIGKFKHRAILFVTPMMNKLNVQALYINMSANVTIYISQEGL